MIGNLIKTLTKRSFPELTSTKDLPAMQAELEQLRTLDQQLSDVREKCHDFSPRGRKARNYGEAFMRRINRVDHLRRLATVESLVPQAGKSIETALASIGEAHANAHKRLSELQAAHAQRDARCESLKARKGELQQRASEPVKKAQQDLDQAVQAGDDDAAQAASDRLTAALRALRQIDEELAPLDAQIQATGIVIADTEMKIETIKAEIQGIENQANYYRRELCALQLDKAAVGLIRAALPFYADGGKPLRPGAGHGLSVQLGHSQTLRKMADDEIKPFVDFGDQQLRDLGYRLIEHPLESALAGCLADLETLSPDLNKEEDQPVVVTLDPQQRDAA